MVADLNLDVEIVRLPIVREADGLAMSSVTLPFEEERKRLQFYIVALEHVKKRIEEGERKSKP